MRVTEKYEVGTTQVGDWGARRLSRLRQVLFGAIPNVAMGPNKPFSQGVPGLKRPKRQADSVMNCWREEYRMEYNIREENSTLLGYYAASSGNLLRVFWNYLLVPYSRLTLKDGTNRLSRNVRKKLPLLAA